MKIDKSSLSNIFNQYNVEENRITNAFLQVLANNKSFLKKFFEKHLWINIPINAKVKISAQKKPYMYGDIKQETDENDTVPDGWIIIDEKTAVVFESKIEHNKVKRNQLEGHIRAINNYANKYLCLITPDEQPPIQSNLDILGAKVKWVKWRDIYELASKDRRERGLEEFLKKELRDFLSMKDNLVGFQGIDFNPETFDRDKAKIVLKSLIKEIKPDIIKIYPKFNIEKSNYTTEIHPYKVSAGGVWSYLAADKNFTNDIHMTFWLTETHMGMGLTTPNNAGARWKRLKDISENDNYFNEFIVNLLRLRKKVPNLYLEFLQRHYIGRKFGVVDGIFEMNLDTFKGGNNIKVNELWLKSLRNMIINKKGFNGQLMLRTRYFYIKDKNIKKAAFKDEVIRAAEMFKEIYDYLMK